MNYEFHLSVSEMNLLLPAIENYIEFLQTSNDPAFKASKKAQIERLRKMAEKLKLLNSYAKINTQAEKTRKQAEAKKKKYLALVSDADSHIQKTPTVKDIETLLHSDLDDTLPFDCL